MRHFQRAHAYLTGFRFCVQQLGKGDYLLGAEFSAADIILGHSLVICGLVGLTPSDDFPNIAAYDARLKARPAYRKAFELDA